MKPLPKKTEARRVFAKKKGGKVKHYEKVGVEDRIESKLIRHLKMVHRPFPQWTVCKFCASIPGLCMPAHRRGESHINMA